MCEARSSSKPQEFPIRPRTAHRNLLARDNENLNLTVIGLLSHKCHIRFRSHASSVARRAKWKLQEVQRVVFCALNLLPTRLDESIYNPLLWLLTHNRDS